MDQELGEDLSLSKCATELSAIVIVHLASNLDQTQSIKRAIMSRGSHQPFPYACGLLMYESPFQ